MRPGELGSLPIVVTAPGDYVTRDGRRVTVRHVEDARPGTTAFTVRGSLWSVRNGTTRPRGNDVWHVSGRHMVSGESPRDIIGPHERKRP